MEGDECPSSSNSSNKNKNLKKSTDKITNKLTTTFVRYVIPGPIKSWRKFKTKRKQKRISKKIDENLKKDDHFCVEMLVLGARASGKTTICKQIKILYGQELSDHQNQTFVKIIDKNIKEGILSLIGQGLIDTSNFELEEKILFIESYNFNIDTRRQFYFYVETLWNNPHVQGVLQNAIETQLIATTKYFLDKIKVLKFKDYKPTNEDILHCYQPTEAALEIKFEIDSSHYKISEIPNLKYEKRRWKQIIDGIRVVIFVIPINTFLELSDKETNPFKDAVEEFKKFRRNVWFLSGIRCIIFLNKVDLFSKNILEGSVNLDECFPRFSENKSFRKEECIVTNAKAFVSSAFAKEADAIERWYRWYMHFTCAVNSEDISNIYQQCHTFILNSYICSLQFY